MHPISLPVGFQSARWSGHGGRADLWHCRQKRHFVRVWEGCKEEAAKQGDRCILIGRDGPAHFRQQDLAIQEAIRQKFDALAVSVTNSEWLAGASLKEAAKKGIPIITFDSDLAAPYQRLRKAFIGIDNEEFGRLLGSLVQQSHPRGGRLCLMTGDAREPNLNQRMKGVRDALGKNQHRPDDRLSGQGGWVENARCPWFTLDSIETSLRQIEFTLNALDSDILVSVGHWPVVNPALFRSALTRSLKAHPDKLIFVGVGTPQPEQLALLKDRLIAGMIAIDFKQMGRASYTTMRKIVDGKPFDPIVHLPPRIIHPPGN